MFYLLSKIFWLFAQPLNFIFLLVLAGALAAGLSRPVLSRTLIWSGLTLFAIGGFTSVGGLLLMPLEHRHPRPATAPAEIAGIIVLGGGLYGFDDNGEEIIQLSETADRYTEALMLAAAYPDAPIVLTGGLGSLGSKGKGEAHFAAQLMERLGVLRTRMILEPDSRTTYENALLTKQLVNPDPGKPWLLVTSAFHMPRSVGVFEQAGYRIEPWPTDFHTTKTPAFFFDFTNPGGHIDDLSIALKEWIGLLAYFATGKTTALIP